MEIVYTKSILLHGNKEVLVWTCIKPEGHILEAKKQRNILKCILKIESQETLVIYLTFKDMSNRSLTGFALQLFKIYLLYSLKRSTNVRRIKCDNCLGASRTRRWSRTTHRPKSVVAPSADSRSTMPVMMDTQWRLAGTRLSGCNVALKASVGETVAAACVCGGGGGGGCSGVDGSSGPMKQYIYL